MTSTKKCPYCAEKINPEAKKCKHCGEFLHPEIEKSKPVSQAESLITKMSYQKAVLYCLGMGLLMTVVGFVFILLPLLIVIGVPMVICGIMLLVGSPIFALLGVFESDCPVCSHHLKWLGKKEKVKCRKCKQKSLIQDIHLVSINSLVNKVNR